MGLKLNRKVAGYLLAGIAMLLLFLYIRFPSEALLNYLKATVGARYPKSLLTIEALRPSFPPGILLTNVTFGFGDLPEATFHADNLSVSPGWLFLPRGRLAVNMEAEGYGGEASGQVRISRPFSLQGPFTAEATFREVRIDKCAWLREILSRQITGTLGGAISFNGTTEALNNGAGNIEFTLTNGAYPLLESFIGINKIDFSKVDVKLSLRSGVLRITQFTLAGEKLRCSLKGNIRLADNFQESQIDLNGTIELPMQGNKRMTLSISGTISNPKTRFI
jgi:type II secretion system protein N